MDFLVTAKDTEENDRQIAVELKVSPSDLPYSAYLEHLDNKIRIVLYYLNEEHDKHTVPFKDDNCQIEYGENTGRIYSVIIDHNCIKNHRLNIKPVKKYLKWSTRHARFRNNFKLGDDIINKSFARFWNIRGNYIKDAQELE